MKDDIWLEVSMIFCLIAAFVMIAGLVTSFFKYRWKASIIFFLGVSTWIAVSFYFYFILAVIVCPHSCKPEAAYSIAQKIAIITHSGMAICLTWFSLHFMWLAIRMSKPQPNSPLGSNR